VRLHQPNMLTLPSCCVWCVMCRQAAASRAAAAQRAATPAASRQPSLRTPSTTAQPVAPPAAAAGKGKAAPAAAAANGKAGGGRGRGKQKQGPLPADAGPAAHPLPRIESTTSEDGPVRHMHPTHSASAPVLVPAVPPAGMRRSDSAGAASNGPSGASFEAPMSSSPLGEGLQVGLGLRAGCWSTLHRIQDWCVLLAWASHRQLARCECAMHAAGAGLRGAVLSPMWSLLAALGRQQPTAHVFYILLERRVFQT
jgi:hypothetical protein